MTHSPKLLVTAPEAAKMLSISQRLLWSLSHPRGPIPTTRIAGTRAVRYSVSALEQWLIQQTQA